MSALKKHGLTGYIIYVGLASYILDWQVIFFFSLGGWGCLASVVNISKSL